MKTETIRMLRLRVLALITVAGTAWISFSSSQDLAVRAGFGLRAWAFPVCLDAVAAFAVDVWMRRTAAQRPAAALALTAIGLSLASNVADHYLTAGTALAALLGGIPPAMLAWLLLVLHKHGQPVVAREPELFTHRTPEPSMPPEPPRVTPVTEPTPVFLPWPVNGEQVREVIEHAERVAPSEPVRPLPTNVPDNDPERTQLMPRITDEEPGKFDPTATGPAPAKVQPARRVATEVTEQVASEAHRSNEELISLAMERGLTSRRAITAAFGVGTKRATDIARTIKEKTNG